MMHFSPQPVQLLCVFLAAFKFCYYFPNSELFSYSAYLVLFDDRCLLTSSLFLIPVQQAGFCEMHFQLLLRIY